MEKNIFKKIMAGVLAGIFLILSSCGESRSGCDATTSLTDYISENETKPSDKVETSDTPTSGSAQSESVGESSVPVASFWESLLSSVLISSVQSESFLSESFDSSKVESNFSVTTSRGDFSVIPSGEETPSGTSAGSFSEETVSSSEESFSVESSLSFEESPSQGGTSFAEEEKRSLLNLLQNAVLPMGKTMYVWGGGWNEEDTGAGIEAVTLGISPKWEEFAEKQNENYDFKNYRYQIHDGLDCSGYIGWLVYNTLESENGREGYVFSSGRMAKTLASKGLGEYIPAEEMTEWKPGDIMSMSGHTWIVFGMCADGSVLFAHSSPPGVMLCGTYLENGDKSEAILLAERYMEAFFPEWYAKYPECGRSYTYLEKSSAMRFNRETLTDGEGLFDMSAEQVLNAVFNENS